MHAAERYCFAVLAVFDDCYCYCHSNSFTLTFTFTLTLIFRLIRTFTVTLGVYLFNNLLLRKHLTAFAAFVSPAVAPLFYCTYDC